MTDIGFGLWMNFRIAINLAGGSLQNPGRFPSGELEHVHGADDAGFHRPDRIALVVAWRSRARQIVDAVDIAIDVDRLAHVMFDESEIWVIEQRPHITHRSGEQIIDADNPVAPLKQRIAKMRADKAGAHRDERPVSGPCTAWSVDPRLNCHIAFAHISATSVVRVSAG